MEGTSLENLVFEGGGLSGFASMLALEALATLQPGCLDGVRKCAGTSIGALLALLVVLGVLPNPENLSSLRKIFAFHSKEYTPNLWQTVTGLCRRFGALPTTVLQHLVQECVDLTSYSTLRGREFTFLELFTATGKTLVVTAHNVHTMENVYLHHFAYPDAPVLTCVVASMTFPLAFEPVKSLELGGREPAGSWYVDGGVLDNYPLALFSNAGWEKLLPCDVDPKVNVRATLGFKILGKHERFDRDVYSNRTVESLGLGAYVLRVLYTSLAYSYEATQYTDSAFHSTLQLPATGVFDTTVLNNGGVWHQLQQEVFRRTEAWLAARSSGAGELQQQGQVATEVE